MLNLLLFQTALQCKTWVRTVGAVLQFEYSGPGTRVAAAFIFCQVFFSFIYKISLARQIKAHTIHPPHLKTKKLKN